MTREEENSTVQAMMPLAKLVASQHTNGGDPATYELVLSDALLGLLQGIRTHDPEGGMNLKNWCSMKMCQRIKDGYRERDVATRGQRQRGKAPRIKHLSAIQQEGEKLLAWEDEKAKDPSERAELADEVEKALKGLSRRDRLILWHLLADERSRKAVAEETGISETRVYQIVREKVQYIREREGITCPTS